MPNEENEVLMISTEMGEDFVRRGMKRLDELSGIRMQHMPEEKTKGKAPQSKVVLVNPSTEQRASFTDPEKNRTSIEALMRQGYAFAEAEGELPPWLVRP